jgi:hypothetical protein
MGTVVGLLVVVGLAAYGAFWLWMLYEIGKRPDFVYQRVGESKAVWFVLVLVLQLFGTLGYFFMAREKLIRAEREALTPGLITE